MITILILIMIFILILILILILTVYDRNHSIYNFYFLYLSAYTRGAWAFWAGGAGGTLYNTQNFFLKFFKIHSKSYYLQYIV